MTTSTTFGALPPSPPRLRAAVAALLLASVVWGLDAVARAAQAVRGPVPVLCYVETLFGDVRPAELDVRPCTHVIEAFLLVEPSGALSPDNGLPRRGVIAAARGAGARVVVSVGGSAVPGSTFSEIAQDPRRSARFLRELAAFVARSGYDGVDLDWEFPAPTESQLHLRLTRAIRHALDATGAWDGRPPVVTVPVAAHWLASYDFAGLTDVVDYVVLMGYDFRNPALGPWSNAPNTLWPADSPAPIESSVRGAASAIVRLGLPHDKLIIALPMFTSANQPWVRVRERVLSTTSPLHPDYLERQIDDIWVTDPEALKRKIDAALKRGEIRGGDAVGIGLWQLGHQGRHRDLTEAVLRSLPRRAP